MSSTQLRFREIQIRNFLSFGNSTTTIDLSNFGSTLIQGENIDANGANGAGKTTIINAICYALYNKPFDNISLQRLINSTNSTKNTLMEVRLLFDKGDDEYEVYRCRGETFNIEIKLNNEDITLDSVTNNDQAIQEIIGMSYDLFTKIIVFSGNSIPFLMMPLAAQRGQIEELFNITLLTEKSIKLKEIIKTTEGSIAIAEAIIKEQEAQAALFKKQLTTAAARITLWDTDRTKNVNAMREQLELLKTVNMEDEKELHSFISECQKQQHNLNSKLLVAKKDRTSATADVKRLKDELHHLLDEKCPYCLQKYEGAAEKLVEKKDVLEKKEARLADLEAFISKTSSEVLALAAQITEAESLIKFPSYADAVKAETGATTAQSKINDLIDAINPHIEAHEQLKKHAINNVSHAEADELRKDVEHQQFLLRLLTDKNSFIRRRIINRTIPFLNNRLIHYTKEIGLPHIVKFDDDMSCTVSEYGRELDFGNLSSGEKKRVNLSLSLAFRDVLHHLHARVNCLFIDEIDASLDGAGVESVFRLLKQKSRDDGLGLWIISHRPEAVGRFDRTLLVRKENGFSSIITDEEMETA